MAETQTPNFHWIKPDIGGDASVWGNVLNSTIDAVDSVVFNNQQGLVPIGSISMFAGSAAPANWLLCQGQSLSTTGTYAALFAIVGYTYGGSGANFNLPDLRSRLPMGAGTLGATGGAATVTLDATMIPAHTHPASQAAHTHPGSYQDAHVHAITTGGHSHTITTGSHSHTLNAQVLTPNAGGNAGAGAGWGFNTVGMSTAGNLGGNTDTAGNLGGSADSRQPAVHIDTQQPAITVAANTGGGAAHDNLPPYLSINFIIRFA